MSMKSDVFKFKSLIVGVVKKLTDGVDASSNQQCILINGAEKQQVIKTNDQLQHRKPDGFGERHLQIFLLFSGYALAYSHKVNLSFGIVAMEAESEKLGIDTYDWDERTRGFILSSLFWGYIITPLPVGIIAHRYGAKIPLFFAILISSIATLFTPIFASMGWPYLCAIRFIIGMMQGSVCPCLHTLLSKWIHPTERSFLSSITYSGGKVGIILTLASSGFISASSIGWPGIFYCGGGFSLIWTIVWLAYGCNCPSESETISKEEKEFIQSACQNNSIQKKPIPWRDIMTSPPFVCLIFVHAAASWGYFLLLTEMPSYINGVLHFDIKQNALFSALPYLLMLIILIVLSHLSDTLLARKCFSVTFGRKLFNTIGMWIPMLCLIALAYVHHNSTLSIILLTLAVGFNAGVYIGFFINYMDLSPNYAGTLVGITSAFAHLMSVFAPIFVGYLVTDKNDPLLWNTVFWVSAGVYFFGNLFFLLFGEAKIQKWNDFTRKTGLCKLV